MPGDLLSQLKPLIAQAQTNTSGLISQKASSFGNRLSDLKPIIKQAQTKTSGLIPQLDFSIRSQNSFNDYLQNIFDEETQNFVDEQTQNILNEQTQNILNEQTQNILNEQTQNILNEQTQKVSNPSGGQTQNSPGGNVGANMSSVFSIIGNVSNIASGFASPKTTNTNSAAQKQTGNLLMKTGDPTLSAIGAGVNAFSTIGDFTNTNSSVITDKERDAIKMSKAEQVANNALSYIPMAGAAMTKVQDVYKNDDVNAVSGGYSNTVNFIDTMASMSGNRYAGKNANMAAADANAKSRLLTDISRTSTIRKSSNILQELQHQMNSKYNGISQGKEGVKLLSKDELEKIYAHKKKPIKYQNGGSILIPDGALHKNLHNMEDSNPELAKEVTKKGIPVVVTNEKGEVQQCAEIEKNEMILEKSLTNKVEELWKKGDEEAMIECGKLIVKTLFTNCDDNTGLVKEVE